MTVNWGWRVELNANPHHAFKRRNDLPTKIRLYAKEEFHEKKRLAINAILSAALFCGVALAL
jgi:hypothetical protein